jgi:hypothetical protein
MTEIKSGDLVSVRTPCRIGRMTVPEDLPALIQRINAAMRDSSCKKILNVDLNRIMFDQIQCGKFVQVVEPGTHGYGTFRATTQNRIQAELFECKTVMFVLGVCSGPVFDVERPLLNRMVRLTTLLYQEKKYLFATWADEHDKFLRKIV